MNRNQSLLIENYKLLLTIRKAMRNQLKVTMETDSEPVQTAGVREVGDGDGGDEGYISP